MAIVALQSASSALTALNTAMDVTANNLANVNTAGFKSSRANFQDLLYLQKAQPGVRNANDDERPTGLFVGLGTKVSGTQLNFAPGSPIQGNKLDLFVQGNGFFRVSLPESLGPGGVGYTRSGQFVLNSDGEMVLASDQGRRLDPPITIDGDVLDVQIDANGRVLVQRPGEVDPEEVGQLQLSNFVNPVGLKSIGENLYVETAASGPAIDGDPGTDAFGEILQGYYEGSNVDPTKELIDLIRIQRAFEMNSSTIRAADENLRVIGQLRR